MLKSVFDGMRDLCQGRGSRLVTKADSGDNFTGHNSGAADEQIMLALYVTGAGDVVFVGADGQTDTWTVPANFTIPVPMKRVMSTSTSATGMHAII